MGNPRRLFKLCRCHITVDPTIEIAIGMGRNGYIEIVLYRLTQNGQLHVGDQGSGINDNI